MLVDAGGVLVVDEGVTVDASSEATIEMSDTPSQNGVTRSGASLVSMFQANLVGVKVIRYLNWEKRSDAVAFRRIHLDASPVF